MVILVVPRGEKEVRAGAMGKQWQVDTYYLMNAIRLKGASNNHIVLEGQGELWN